MSAIASSSRATMLRQCKCASRATTRAFASSSRQAAPQQVSVSIANVKATIELPELQLPRWMTGWFDNGNGDMPAPVLAGMANEVTSDDATSSSDVLDWDGLTWASVPKQRTSHAKKRMRSAHKGLKDRTDFVFCAGCGQPKVSHHICAFCYSRAKHDHKRDVELVRKELAEEGLESLRLEEPAKFARKKKAPQVAAESSL